MKAVQMLAGRTASAAIQATRSTLQTSTRRLSTTVTRNLTRTSIQVPLRNNLRSFSSSQFTQKGLSPESSDPPPPKTEDHSTGSAAAELTDSEYHEIADQYLNSLVLALEDLADGEKGGSEGVEVEFAVRYATHLERTTLTHSRLEFSLLDTQRKAPMSSISSLRTNRSGSQVLFLDPSDSTGRCPKLVVA